VLGMRTTPSYVSVPCWSASTMMCRGGRGHETVGRHKKILAGSYGNNFVSRLAEENVIVLLLLLLCVFVRYKSFVLPHNNIVINII